MGSLKLPQEGGLSLSQLGMQLCRVKVISLGTLSSWLPQRLLLGHKNRLRVELCVYYGGRLIAPVSVTPFNRLSEAPEIDFEVTGPIDILNSSFSNTTPPLRSAWVSPRVRCLERRFLA